MTMFLCQLKQTEKYKMEIINLYLYYIIYLDKAFKHISCIQTLDDLAIKFLKMLIPNYETWDVCKCKS